MGSGCTNNSNCNNIFGERTPDKQVVYTGPAIPALGICTGDLLSEIEAVILQKLIDYSTGIGISIPSIDLTTCEAFEDCLTCCDGCTDLPCLLECYKNTICKIWELIKDLDDPFDIGCLTGVTSISGIHDILQALITAHCELLDAVTTIQNQIVNLQNQINIINNTLPTTIGNFLLNHITSCQGSTVVNKTGTGANTFIDFKGGVPIGTIMPYGGPTAGLFDSSGRGLTNTGMCGYALCNGLNGTIDMRELVPMGAGAGVMGGGTLASNTSGANYGVNALVGSTTVLLTAAQSGLVGHAHDLLIYPHSHRFKFTGKSANDNNNLGGSHPDTYMGFGGTDRETRYFYEPPTGSPGSYAFVTEDFGVSNTPGPGQTLGYVQGIGDQGAKEAHPNVQPSRALLFIQRIN